MGTPWTPPGQELPEAAPTRGVAGPPPPYPPPVPAQLQRPPYPAYPAYPAYPGGPHPAGSPPSKAMAGWALGLAVVGCATITWVISVVLAIIVLAESGRDSQDRGKGMAIAALVINGLWVVVLVLGLAAGFAPSDSGSVEGGRQPVDIRTNDEPRRVVPSMLQVGDCFNDNALAGLATSDADATSEFVTVLPCERRHDFEVFYLFSLRGDTYPGRDVVVRRARAGCPRAFASYVGSAYSTSQLATWFYYPTPAAWKRLDDRGVTCVIGEPGKKTAGTLRLSHR